MIKKAILIAIAIVLFASFAMVQTIEIDAIRENQTDQTCFITINYKGTNYKFHVDTPLMSESDVLIWIKARKEKIAYLILLKQYPGADMSRFLAEGETKLSAIIAWIQDGHRNIIGYDEEENPIYEVIEKKPFKSTHPFWIKALTEIDEISNLEELKAFLKKIIRHIR